MNYYNEFDPKAAAWLRELIKAGLIPEGEVDERSICDVKPTELHGYAQCHFFAGIGGWSRALQLAGWPEDRPVWTGSCPCQPFSAAGKGLGVADERHLWPVFAGLIRECKPPTVFGEQVASKAGREWLAGVFADLEGMGYHRAGADLCAAGVGAPHIRQRLWWVAHAAGQRRTGIDPLLREKDKGRVTAPHLPEIAGGSLALGLEHTPGDGRVERGSEPSRGCEAGGCGSDHGGLAVSRGNGSQAGIPEPKQRDEGNPEIADYGRCGKSFWGGAVRHPCRDGKARRIEPSIFPLAHGIPGRVGLLRGAGNAIVPQVAAEFISAFMEVEQ